MFFLVRNFVSGLYTKTEKHFKNLFKKRMFSSPSQNTRTEVI